MIDFKWRDVLDLKDIFIGIAVILIILGLWLGLMATTSYEKNQKVEIDELRSDFCWQYGFNEYRIRNEKFYCWNTGNGKIWEVGSDPWTKDSK